VALRGAVVVVVALAPVVVVVVVVPFEDGAVVVVVAVFGDVVGVGPVVVVVEPGTVVVVVVVVAGGAPPGGTKTFFTDGSPASTWMPVTTARASRKTITSALAMADRLNRRGEPVRRGTAAARWVAGVSAISLTSSGAVLSRGGNEVSAGELVSRIWTVSSLLARDPASKDPLAFVAPSRRTSVCDSGARTTTCFTASWPRSIDCTTSAETNVATAAPMATPTIVPVTPKMEAMSAARTAPATDAKI
jgi:hypothetical protein